MSTNTDDDDGVCSEIACVCARLRGWRGGRIGGCVRACLGCGMTVWKPARLALLRSVELERWLNWNWDVER